MDYGMWAMFSNEEAEKKDARLPAANEAQARRANQQLKPEVSSRSGGKPLNAVVHWLAEHFRLLGH